MKHTRKDISFAAGPMITGMLVLIFATPMQAVAASAEKINKDVDAALERFKAEAGAGEAIL